MAEPKLQTLPDAISVAGLDGIFEDVATGDDSKSSNADTMSSETIDVSATDDSTDEKYVLVSEAAARLKKSERTIQRWASAKKIPHKIDESGRMWVAVPSAADIKVTYADTDASEISAGGVDKLSSLVAKLTDDLLQAKDQLSVASGQIGYLKAHLEEREKDLQERDEKIKLLTDSQQKTVGWWGRFCSWFMGRPSNG
ncbi:MAG TPA: helix-turn-helix domain-containing protein [Oculatellaceae cyanobacterium]